MMAGMICTMRAERNPQVLLLDLMISERIYYGNDYWLLVSNSYFRIFKEVVLLYYADISLILQT
jgi:hypothetical protein